MADATSSETVHPFLHKVRSGAVLLGLNHMYPAAAIIEGAARGWDFVWIDAQHGQFSIDAQVSSIRAAGVVGVDTIVRVPGHEYGVIGPSLDLAPSGVMVPMVNDAAEARAIVRASRFPPRGMRSYGGRRPIDLYGREFYRRMEPVLVAQIETVEGSRNAREIAAVDGVDVLFFGPDDMKAQLGLPIDTVPLEHPRLRDAMADMAEAATEAGKVAMCIATKAADLKTVVAMGYRMIVGGGDVMFVRTTAAAKLTELREAATQQAAAPAPSTTSAPSTY